MTTAQAVILFLLIFFYRWLYSQCPNVIQLHSQSGCISSTDCNYISKLFFVLLRESNKRKKKFKVSVKKISIICGSCHNLADRNNYSSRCNYTKPLRNLDKNPYPSVQSSFINAYERRAKYRDQCTLGCTAGHRCQGERPFLPWSLRQEG